MLRHIDIAFPDAKQRYDRGIDGMAACWEVTRRCLLAIADNAIVDRYGPYAGKPPVDYVVATSGKAISRPFRIDLCELDPAAFDALTKEFDVSIGNQLVPRNDLIDRIVYTSVTAFSVAYDLWRPGSRKTPGTFFEVLIGSMARGIFPQYTLSKHIPIKDISIKDDASAESGGGRGESVSTDLVITNPQTGMSAVVPLKITTRERIVQPFAHQRILDSAYPGRYASFITCISEVQRDEKTQSVKQICVPGTVALFQKHLSKVNGLYYCDIPQRYGNEDFKKVMPVKSFSCLFTDVAAHLAKAA